jgi:putative hydrolase of HD superfamily
MTTDRLTRQIAFLTEIDRLKQVLRRTSLVGGERRENTAEHSWHVCMIALVLAEYSNEPVDLFHAIRMLLVHDIVEIDAGDTFAFDVAANLDKAEREQVAAERIFGLLPADQAEELRGLWEEFDAMATPEARFANMCDRLMPALQNHANGGGTWNEANLDRAAVERRLRPIGMGAAEVGDYVDAVIADAVAQGWIRP